MNYQPMMRAFAGVAAAVMFGTAQAEPVTVDNCGTPLTFDTMPERMVVHDINMSEMAFALGLQDRMVGVTGITGWYKTTAKFDEARGSLPELAPKYPTIENLVAAAPDLFFAGWYYGMRPGGDVTPETLAPHGIKTLILTESCVHLDKSRPAASLDLLYSDVKRLGRIFGKDAEAAALVAGWQARVAEIKAEVGDVSGTRVFLYDSGEDKTVHGGQIRHADRDDRGAGRHQHHRRHGDQLGDHLVGGGGRGGPRVPDPAGLPVRRRRGRPARVPAIASGDEARCRGQEHGLCPRSATKN